MQTHSGAYLKNHSRNLHAPLCSIFSLNPTKRKLQNNIKDDTV